MVIIIDESVSTVFPVTLGLFERFSFMFNNSVLAATSIVASTNATGFPAENVRNTLRKRQLITPLLPAPAVLIMDFVLREAVSFSCFAAVGHSVTSGADIQMAGYSDVAFGTKVVQQKLAHDPDILIDFFPTVTIQSVRLAMSETTAETLALGHVYIGDHFRPDHGADLEFRDLVDDLSELGQGLGLTRTVNVREQRRHFEWLFQVTDETELRTFETLGTKVGNSLPIFVAADPVDHLHSLSFYGSLDGPIQLNRTAGFNVSSVAISFTEGV